MDVYKPNDVGKYITFGGEHIVYEDGPKKVIKFSMNDYLWGPAWGKKAQDDYAICKKHLRGFVLDTRFLASPDGKRTAQVQTRVSGEPLMMHHLQKDTIREQLEKIALIYRSMTAESRTIDLLGLGGVFKPCLSNIFVRDTNELCIIDATLLDSEHFPFVHSRIKSILNFFCQIVIRRQERLLEQMLAVSRKGTSQP
jgi:hypothetical protein